MPISQLAIIFFLVVNPIGNSPLILSLVKNFSLQRQQQIMLREGFIALAMACLFQFFGEYFLNFLGIKMYSLSLCGGIILLLTAFKMLFTSKEAPDGSASQKEPMIVPIAIPLLTGPGLMTTIMIYATQEGDPLKITGALGLAWVVILLVMYTAPYMQKILGKRGMSALEQIMGLILAFMAVEMLLAGIGNFYKQMQ